MAVTSRRAYSRPSPGASSADCAARARWCCATWRTKSSAPTEVRTPGMASSLSMVPPVPQAPAGHLGHRHPRPAWGPGRGWSCPHPAGAVLVHHRDVHSGRRRRPLSARAMVKARVSAPSRPASRRPSARPPSGSLAPPGAGRPLPASAPPCGVAPPPRLCAIRSTARSTWPSGPGLSSSRAFVLPAASGAFRAPSAPSAPSASSTATRRTRSVRVISPAGGRPADDQGVEAVLGEPFGDVLQGRVFGDGVIAELLGHDLARGAGDHRRVSASSSRRRRMVSMGMAIPNRLR